MAAKSEAAATPSEDPPDRPGPVLDLPDELPPERIAAACDLLARILARRALRLLAVPVANDNDDE